MNNFYVATAIPYVNDKPHIGHAMDYMLADVLSRYHRLQGENVFFGTGTDEHGTKIAAKAKEAGQEPKAYVDSIVPAWSEFFKKMNIEPSDFIRTTEERHIKAVTYIWKKLEPYIYKGSYEGWYCVGCESFVTAKQAADNNGICPDHKKPYQQLSEENYYFKLSAFNDQIKQAIEEGQLIIEPEFRQKEILNLLSEGLEDLSISRPVKNLSWGVPVPGDPTQVIYVWFDALSNYISILDYPDGEKYKTFWPADVQVIGKDILRFHAAIWPAMLIGLGEPLPKKLLVHGHVLASGTKMSKTIGNVIDPIEVVNDYGVDAFRYYFLRHIPTTDDGDFTWEKFENAYNNELGNELGNLVQRVASMINRYQSGAIGDMPRPEHDAQLFHDAIAEMRFDRALDSIWNMVRGLNVYLEDVKPWEIAKDPDDAEHLQEVLAYAAGSLTQIGELLKPFLPTTAAAIEHMFEGGVIKPYNGVLFPKVYKYTTDPRSSQPKTTE